MEIFQKKCDYLHQKFGGSSNHTSSLQLQMVVDSYCLLMCRELQLSSHLLSLVFMSILGFSINYLLVAFHFILFIVFLVGVVSNMEDSEVDHRKGFTILLCRGLWLSSQFFPK